MNLDKAIEILSSNGLCPEQTTWGDYLDAVKLGQEALKFWKRLTDAAGDDFTYLLPGETPEIDTKRSLHHIRAVLSGNEVRK